MILPSRARRKKMYSGYANGVQSHKKTSTKNATKSSIGVSNGKFLGFVVTSKGIHLDPNNVKAI